MNDMQKFLKKARQVCLKRNPMTMEEIDCIIHEDSSERLTRQQMMEKYPNRWIGINNIEYEDLERKIIKAADVVYTNKTASELGLISLKEKIVIPFYTTSDDTYQMGALATEDRKENKNVVVISEAEYNNLLKAKRNAEYLAHLDRSFAQLERGEVIVKSMEELEHLADEIIS